MTSPGKTYRQVPESYERRGANLVAPLAPREADLTMESPNKNPCAIEPGERKVIDQVIGRLAPHYPDVPDERVAEVVIASYARFDGRPIRDYVPLFVERDARSQLAQMSG